MSGNITVFKGYKSMYYSVQRIQAHVLQYANTCACLVHIVVMQLCE